MILSSQTHVEENKQFVLLDDDDDDDEGDAVLEDDGETEVEDVAGCVPPPRLCSFLLLFCW